MTNETVFVLYVLNVKTTVNIFYVLPSVWTHDWKSVLKKYFDPNFLLSFQVPIKILGREKESTESETNGVKEGPSPFWGVRVGGGGRWTWMLQIVNDTQDRRSVSSTFIPQQNRQQPSVRVMEKTIVWKHPNTVKKWTGDWAVFFQRCSIVIESSHNTPSLVLDSECEWGWWWTNYKRIISATHSQWEH